MKNIIHFITLLLSVNVFSQLSVEIDKLSINTDNEEFAPAFFDNGLLVVSNRKNSVLKTYIEIDNKGEEHFLNDIFYVNFKGRDSIHNSISPLPINKEDVHDGPVSVSQDNFMVIARTQQITSGSKRRPKTKNTTSGLFFYIKEGKNWVENGSFPHNSNEYNISHPSISPNGQLLYFVSDMKGGLGGMDIWYSSRNNGIWSKPINAGKLVNSTNNEVFPFLTKNGTLYFASNKPGGKGGYDIYSKNPNTKIVHPLEAPINTASDEYALITNDFGHSGFFTSNRVTNNDDIYHFRRTVTLPDVCNKSQKTKMCYTFYDAKPIPEGASVKHEWDFGDNTKGYGSELEHCYEETGNYHVVLSLIDSVTGQKTENISELTLIIEPSSKYYFELKEDKEHQMSIAFLDPANDSPIKISDPIYWKFENQIVYDHDYLNFVPEYQGEYIVSGYLKENNTFYCIYDTISINDPINNSAKLINFKLLFRENGELFNQNAKQIIFEKMMKHPDLNKFTLDIPSEDKFTTEWEAKVIASFKKNFDRDLTIERIKYSTNILLKIHE